MYVCVCEGERACLCMREEELWGGLTMNFICQLGVLPIDPRCHLFFSEVYFIF